MDRLPEGIEVAGLNGLAEVTVECIHMWVHSHNRPAGSNEDGVSLHSIPRSYHSKEVQPVVLNFAMNNIYTVKKCKL